MAEKLPDNPDAVCGGGLDTAERQVLFDQGSKKFWWKNADGEWIGRDKAAVQVNTGCTDSTPTRPTDTSMYDRS